MSISLVLVFGLSLAQATVYRCAQADGRVAYQDHPCAHGAEESTVRMPDVPVVEPPPAPSVAATLETDSKPKVDAAPMFHPPPPPRAATAWRCVADNGEVFYRHDRCPGSIPVIFADVYGFPASGTVFVDAYEIPRTEACAAIKSAGHFGADRDQRAQPYDKLTGRDLCK